MKRILNMAGAAVALVAVSAAVPAQARDHWDRHDGIDAGDVLTGVAVIGGVAAIAAALDRDGGRYGYGYRSGYHRAVNACAYHADRYGRGQVRIVDVDRRGNDRYRVRGVLDVRDGYRDHRYDRYDRGRRDLSFSCTARSSGRVTDFDVHRRNYW